MWTERLLVRQCQLSDLSTNSNNVDATNALQAYRFWAKYWDIIGKNSASEGMGRPRRSAWKAYYDTLSTILQKDIPYPAEHVAAGSSNLTPSEKPAPQSASSRLQQLAELKRVETIYEGLLLRETKFPKASESNQETESWTDAAMSNWWVLCGPTWTDSDLGEGGKEAVGRGVLDVRLRPFYSINLGVSEPDECCLDLIPGCHQDLSLHPDPPTLVHCPRVSRRV